MTNRSEINGPILGERLQSACATITEGAWEFLTV